MVAHNCSDGTAIAAQEAGARVVELKDPRQRGKGAALRCGFRSALVADNLRKMGYENPVSLDGGWKALKESGLPVE